MTTTSVPLNNLKSESHLADCVTEGLLSRPKWLPSWLFYDAEGSRLFDQITELPEYYLTRTERAILTLRAEEIIAEAAQGDALHIVELGAGSCDKTRILLRAAVERQDTVFYEPLDVSAAALEEARTRIEEEIPDVLVCPHVVDYTRSFALDSRVCGHRRLVLYIGSSIGNFEPHQARTLLENVHAALEPGDAILLGVDLVKDEGTLLDAYDDAAGVTAAFNRNILHRLNRDLGANFDPLAFAHRAVWNPRQSRIEMHLESRILQTVRIPSLDSNVCFAPGETIHTENSYKYHPTQSQALLRSTGFQPAHTWTDDRGWFSVCLARAEGKSS
jgi:L-histidine Nalpha-methyltransferase